MIVRWCTGEKKKYCTSFTEYYPRTHTKLYSADENNSVIKLELHFTRIKQNESIAAQKVGHEKKN